MEIRKRAALFDLDGLLCDFVAGSLAVHSAHLPMAEVTWDFPAQIGFEKGAADPAFWSPLSNAGFWEGLKPLEDGMAVFRAVAAQLPKDRIGFLSSGIVPGASDGKRAWIARHLPGWEKHLILGTHKALLAAPCKVLVDDYGPNVEGFRAAGGRAVLVPRPWNSRRVMTCDQGRFDSGRIADEVLAELLS